MVSCTDPYLFLHSFPIEGRRHRRDLDYLDLDPTPISEAGGQKI
jgi:hypothetical protein